MQITAKEAFDDISLVKLEYEYVSGPRLINKCFICDCVGCNNSFSFYICNDENCYEPILTIAEDKLLIIDNSLINTEEIIEKRNAKVRFARYKLV